MAAGSRQGSTFAGLAAHRTNRNPSMALRALGDADEHSATTGSGSGSVATVVPAAIEALRAPTVIEGLGATVIRNATGNLQFPRISTKASGTGEGEADENANSGLLMDTVSMTPERVSAKTTYQAIDFARRSWNRYVDRKRLERSNERIH